MQLIGSFTDITHRKEKENRIKLKSRSLELINEELQQFVYVASHDLLEPLKTLCGFADIFEKKYRNKLDDDAYKYLHYITQSSDRMSELVKDLLDYSKIGNTKTMSIVDCEVVLNQVKEDLAKVIEDSKAVFTVGTLPKIKGYPMEIRLLFQNLISNAIKYSKKGVIPEITISAQEIDQFWEFKFEDNGIGILPENLERIFVIFERLHNKTMYEGTGIGLAHCKKIVKLHKGKIWVKSKPNQGSIFYFSIPLQTINNIELLKLEHAN